MLNILDRAKIRNRLRRIAIDERQSYSRADMLSLMSDCEWMLDELDRSRTPKSPLTFELDLEPVPA